VPLTLKPSHRGQWHSRVITSVACLLKRSLQWGNSEHAHEKPDVQYRGELLLDHAELPDPGPQLVVLPRNISSLAVTGVSSLSNKLELLGD
jgi:hypothetical protein